MTPSAVDPVLPSDVVMLVEAGVVVIEELPDTEEDVRLGVDMLELIDDDSDDVGAVGVNSSETPATRLRMLGCKTRGTRGVVREISRTTRRASVTHTRAEEHAEAFADARSAEHRTRRRIVTVGLDSAGADVTCAAVAQVCRSRGHEVG